MGYYVQLDSADWEIEDNPRSLQEIRAMPKKYHAIKRGGSSSGEKWFSWMSDERIENAKSVEDVFKDLGFTTEPGSRPNTFKLTAYDSKTGQEDLFIAVMAPWTTEGSSMEWVGEEGERWRYFIEDKKIRCQKASITWEDPQDFAYQHIFLDPTLSLVPGTNSSFSTSRFNELLISPTDPELNEKLAIAQEWQDKANEYYANIRKEAQGA